jgi:hypothetical protein
VDGDAAWIAGTIDDRPVGFSFVEAYGDLWWLSWFGVTPDGRARCGRVLVENVVVARARRVPKVWCDTRVANTRSITILRGAGFEKICDLPCHWFGRITCFGNICEDVRCRGGCSDAPGSAGMLPAFEM